MIALAQLLIGYTLFSIVVLMLTHFRTDHYPEHRLARVMGMGLLIALGVLQLVHFAWLYFDQPWIESLVYRMALFAVAPSFFLFSRPLLQPVASVESTGTMIWHGMPAVLSVLLPSHIALPMAFIVGAGYLLWLGRTVLNLREERVGFRREMAILGVVFCIAIGVALLGFVQTALPGKVFYAIYACAIGLAFVLVQLTLGLRPNLSTEVVEVVQPSYATSTLGAVDCEAVLREMESLMKVEHLYRDAELTLSGLADRLGLRPHQLSELLNARVGLGFSRYLREQRVRAAELMLTQEPSASVLSVGLSVGFTSQSTFYEAFREICGMTPGQYRKTHLASSHNA